MSNQASTEFVSWVESMTHKPYSKGINKFFQHRDFADFIVYCVGRSQIFGFAILPFEHRPSSNNKEEFRALTTKPVLYSELLAKDSEFVPTSTEFPVESREYWVRIQNCTMWNERIGKEERHDAYENLVSGSVQLQPNSDLVISGSTYIDLAHVWVDYRAGKLEFIDYGDHDLE
jgi:hypothetical protein